MWKLSALAIAFTLLTPAQRESGPELSGAEFPPQDLQIWSQQRRGLVLRRAARHLAEAPASVETVKWLMQAGDVDGVLRVLRRLVDSQPRRLAEALDAVGPAVPALRDDGEASRRALLLNAIVADARKQLAVLPREEAARLERSLMIVDLDDRREWAVRHSSFIDKYQGTEAALLAEVDLIEGGGGALQVARTYEDFARAHPGTTAAAKALFYKGLGWHLDESRRPVTSPDTSADRLTRVLDIVKELESGGYPRSEWTENAPELVIQFPAPGDAQITGEPLLALIDRYREFLRTHFVLDDEDAFQNGPGFILLFKLADLYEMRGERIAGLERELRELEHSGPDPEAASYLRGLFYMQRWAGHSLADQQATIQKAHATFRALSARGNGLPHRKALATLASLEFEAADYRQALASFRKYASSYPGSNWAWVALLRAGQCEEELGDPTGAAATYLAAARRYGDLPLARVLGHEYAARALEASSKFAPALDNHQRALDGWDSAFGDRYSTYRRSPSPDDPLSTAGDGVTKTALAVRIAQLKRSLSVEGGAALERGRWLVEYERYDDADAEMKRLIARHPKSPVLVEARELLHRAQLERALDVLNTEEAAANRTAAKDLEALAREPHDASVALARVACASQLWLDGDAAAAEKLMEAGLSEWHAKQELSKPSPGLEADVAEIRGVLFRPRGGGIYENTHWNGFSWSGASPQFAIVNPDVFVTPADGEPRQLTLRHPLPAADKVLFVDAKQSGLLRRIIVKLGGTRRREWRDATETPNQPVGDAMQIMRLWNKFFHARPGHWGGWETETYPVIGEIQFTDAGRTKASARVTIGYSGATVELEKERGRWVAKRLTNRWVT